MARRPCVVHVLFVRRRRMAFDMGAYVIDLKEIDKTMLPLAGGKGAKLGEIARIKDINVPEGFCITTEAYMDVMQSSEEIRSLLQLLRPYNRDWIGEVCSKIRAAVERVKISKVILDEIETYLETYGEDDAYTIRSSAYAEDFPEATFAGQHDTYLNIAGKEETIKHIGMCWASFFSERAVIYRIENGIDLSAASLAVIVQKMIFPDYSGIMFTADPATSNRKTMTIVTGVDQGESFAQGLSNADKYIVRGGVISGKNVLQDEFSAYAPTDNGGAMNSPQAEADKLTARALTDAQLLRLEKTGRLVEEYFGGPQDIEWLMSDDEIYIAHSRPITDLYPLPEGQNDNGHIYLSYGHRMMMTDAMKPLGISFINLTESFLTPIGGRLYIDLAHDLAYLPNRFLPNAALGKLEPPEKSAINKLLSRADFIKSLERGKRIFAMDVGYLAQALSVRFIKSTASDKPAAVESLITQIESNIAELSDKAAKLSGEQLIDYIKEEYKRFNKALLNAKSRAALNDGIFAMDWVNKKAEKWLGIKSAADTLARSADNNVTANMALELLDVSDVVRQYPEVVEYMRNARDDTFFEDLNNLEGGGAAAESMRAYLDKYGMRCSGEIDITKPRWHETPSALAPTILADIENFEPGAREQILNRGLREAEQMKQDILNRIEKLPAGKYKAKKAEAMIKMLRGCIGYCEYPRYAMARYCWIIKQALQREAGRLVQNGILREPEDAFYLDLDGLRAAIRTGAADYGIIEKRRSDYIAYVKLKPPRVMTSEGEIITGENSKTSFPKGALAGMPVSPGIFEGRARIVTRLEDACAEKDSIIVTAYADPGWAPAFVSFKGLVTEACEMPPHGYNAAREFGFPAVAGVENATDRIRDGQMLRVNGTEGYVEILN